VCHVSETGRRACERDLYLLYRRRHVTESAAAAPMLKFRFTRRERRPADDGQSWELTAAKLKHAPADFTQVDVTQCAPDRADTIQTRHRTSTSTADISRSALCCHSNETRAPIANPPNSAQLEGTPAIPPSYIRVHTIVRQTDRQTAVATIRFSATPHAKCNKWSE